jgi:hypothetical protein
MLVTGFQDSGPPANEHVPQPAPVLGVVIDEKGGVRVGLDVPDTRQPSGLLTFRLRIDRVVKRLAQ